jgi:hypothetical protein
LNIWEADKLIFFIAFIIPGFVSLKTYDLLHPSEAKESSKSLVEALTYSCINYAVLGLPAYYLLSVVILEYPILIWLLAVFTMVVFPILLSFFLSKIRQLEFFQKNAPHPTKMAWDFIFSQRQWYWVIVELTDGKRIGGKYAGNSFASNYPTPVQIYLEECWHLDEDDTFDRPRGGTAGILIASSQIKTVEFFVYDHGEREND